MGESDETKSPATAAVASRGILGFYHRVPLYFKILVGMLLGLLVGLFIDPARAAHFNLPASIILRLLGAVAPPLILIAVIRALMTANVKARVAGKLFSLLILNTCVAILIGLLVANFLRPGAHGALPPAILPKPAAIHSPN